VVESLNHAGKAVQGSRVLVLGVSYKPGVGDLRESPALKLMALLRAQGADLSYHDPHVPELPEQGLRSEDLESALAAADLTVIVTAHAEVDHDRVAREAALVLDLRGVTRGLDYPTVERL
jgi:UDP-N-acetyl-D-glucosamine dehydrogenase